MDVPRRKKNRLPGYDYGHAGVYFVTCCTQGRKACLWDVGEHTSREGEPLPLSAYGWIVNDAIKKIPEHYPAVSVDKYVVMPNHLHIILRIHTNGSKKRTPTIATVMNQMKGRVTKQIGTSIWQKSYHDHVIRNEEDYREIWTYIDINPLKWEMDCFYPGRDASKSIP